MNVAAAARPAAERGDGAVALEAGERRAFCRNEPRDFCAHRFEHGVGCDPLRNERRDTA
jgi:hypothetical protein